MVKWWVGINVKVVYNHCETFPRHMLIKTCGIFQKVLCEVVDEWPWIYRTWSKVITAQMVMLVIIGKEFMNNCTRCRADTKKMSFFFICEENDAFPRRYGSSQKTSHATHFYANAFFCQIWKYFFQNCKRCRADTNSCAIFSQLDWPWIYRSKSLQANHISDASD